MTTKSIFVENCKVYEFNVNSCKNCRGYNHSVKKYIVTFKRPQAYYKSVRNDDTLCIKKRSVDHSADDIYHSERLK